MAVRLKSDAVIVTADKNTEWLILSFSFMQFYNADEVVFCNIKVEFRWRFMKLKMERRRVCVSTVRDARRCFVASGSSTGKDDVRWSKYVSLTFKQPARPPPAHAGGEGGCPGPQLQPIWGLSSRFTPCTCVSTSLCWRPSGGDPDTRLIRRGPARLKRANGESLLLKAEKGP